VQHLAALLSRLDPQQMQVLMLANSGRSAGAFGPGGTGKSMLLRCLRAVLCAKWGQEGVAILASTNAAAVNVGGVTFHSFFGLGVDDRSAEQIVASMAPWRKERIAATKSLAIDEVGMLAAETLDKGSAVAVLIKGSPAPMGGIQSTFVGDPQQLPPVAKAGQPRPQRFFASSSFQAAAPPSDIVFLTTSHRQNNAQQFEVLGRVRLGPEHMLPGDAEYLRSCGSAVVAAMREGKTVTTLFATRKAAKAMNDAKQAELAGDPRTFVGYDAGIISSAISDKVDVSITLKVGSRVLLVANLTTQHPHLVNGAAGRVIAFNETTVSVKFDNVAVAQDINKFTFASTDKQGSEVGWRTAWPLIHGWGITAHRSQGMEFDLLLVDCKGIFECGQFYTMVSRAKTPEGVKLLDFDEKRHVIADPVAVAWELSLRLSSISTLVPAAASSDKLLHTFSLAAALSGVRTQETAKFYFASRHACFPGMLTAAPSHSAGSACSAAAGAASGSPASSDLWGRQLLRAPQPTAPPPAARPHCNVLRLERHRCRLAVSVPTAVGPH